LTNIRVLSSSIATLLIPSAAGEIIHPQTPGENVSRETFRDFVAQLISWILES
jgi:hypothetical protein